MKAIVQTAYGPPDVLALREVEIPACGDGDLRVRVHAAGVERGAWHIMTGLPYLVRVMGYGLKVPEARVLGMEFAGRVDAVGRNVTRFRPGDPVFGAGNGTFAEYVRTREDRVAAKPDGLSFEEAASLAVSGLTALQGLRDRGGLRSGQSVLILGAGGGVGSFAVQIAKALGAQVTGVCSTGKIDLVLSLGADHVVDYTREEAGGGGVRYDLILDTAGNRSLTRLRRLLAPRGTLVLVGGEAGGRWLGGTDRLLRALLLSPFVGQRLRPFLARVRREDLEFLKELVEAGKIRPAVDRTFPLAEAADAMRHLEANRVRGKVVLTV